MSRDDAEAMMKKMQDFTYLVSHDLSAPLRAASSFSNILLDQYGPQLDEQGREYLSLVASEASRAQLMLQGLLEYSRLNTMSKTLTTKIEAARVFEHSTVVLQDEIEKSNAKFTANDLPILQGDSEQFMQLLLFLFDNAIKFARPEEPPHIQFNGTDEGDHWHFTVRDNGIGIEEPYREKIFTIFRQLHVQGTYPGIGMGLTLARKIVERHQGRIWAEGNGEQSGVTIHFTMRKP